MRRIFTLFFALLLSSCGYHLVGQGDGSVIPSGVQSAWLETGSTAQEQALRLELAALWQENEHLPVLDDVKPSQTHITVRLEQVRETFSPIGFDAAGLAVQYRLSISATLRMYQDNSLIWQARGILVSADVFAGDDPSVIESERARLTKQLQTSWARAALARLQSGF
ncbi:LPS-assembly lipoprotein LptE [Ghiorsea bivora]|uniref:hypothetical protein n=1 Tax=Ghiorsea bivora TaxID=1485545 RepID=UPI00056F3ECB|nr:hypothetical protein [Ghiorsea bivora]